MLERVYIRELDEGWVVGTGSEGGLPVPTFEAALEVAEVWMRLTGGREAVFVRADGTMQSYGKSRGPEALNGGD